MNFTPTLATRVMAGEKTVTRRLVSNNPRSPWWRERCSLEVGRDYAVCPGRGKHAIGRVRVRSVRRERLGDMLGSDLAVDQPPIATLEARREGFLDAVAFKLAWLKINGGYDPDAEVWRVEFRVCARESSEVAA
jgi:hypothetical protein